jgi:DNA-binding IclR family transcriptional regulator
MARKPDDQRIRQIYRTVQDQPGKRPGIIARLLGLHRSDVTRLLPVMEEHELYLSEDEQGGLWPFHQKPS